MIFNFLIWIVEVAVLYASPLFSTLKAFSSTSTTQPEQQTWIVHWVLVSLAHLLIYPAINFISSEIPEFVLRLVVLVAIFKVNAILRTQLDSLFLNDDSLVQKLNNSFKELLKNQLLKFGLIEKEKEQ